MEGLETGKLSKKYRGEMTLRKALSISENIPAVRLIEMLGSSSVAQFGQTLGIESPPFAKSLPCPRHVRRYVNGIDFGLLGLS